MIEEKFDKSIVFSLKYEGNFNWILKDGKPVLKNSAKADAGGLTSYGVTNNTLQTAYKQGIVKHNDITKLTVDEAKLIYKKNYWDKWKWGELEWPICGYCLDLAINHGGFAYILQHAVNACGQNVVVDGKFGPKSFAAVKACDPKKLAPEIVKQRKIYYDKIIAKNPKNAIFKRGWYARADAMAKELV